MDSSFFHVFVSTVICFFVLSTCKSCLVSPKEDPKQSTQPPQHQVFINFRGEDLRLGFLSHLVEALENNNIKVFIDKYVDKGDPKETLLTKIEESRIALAILSMKYTESTWCLRELAMIKDCVKNGKLVAIPIFYKLEPSTIRSLRGQFGDSFRDLKECDVTKKEEWEKALKWIPDLIGIIVHEKSPESEILKEIVTEVKKVLKKVPSEGSRKATVDPSENIVDYVMEQRLKQLEEKLDFGSLETQIVGIVGMPGFGKTDLAEMHFNKWNNRFVFNKFIRANDGSDWLKDTLLNGKELNDKAEMFNRRIFVVLDDVSHKNQVNFLLENLEWIKKGSKIVITTRDKSTIAELVHDTYMVPGLNDKEALEFFKHHAFNDQVSSTTGNFMKLSKKYVDYAGGNPRALEELGKELCGKDEAHWETRLATLPHCCNPKEAEIVQAEAKSRRDDNFLGEANSDANFNFENKRVVRECVEGERDGILWDKKSDRNPKEAEIVQAEARDRYTEFSTCNYGAKPGSSSDAKTNTDLLDRTFTNSRMDGIAFENKQSLDELKEKLDLNKISSQLGMIIGCLLLLFFALRQIAYMSTRLISKRGAIDRIAVNVPPAEGTENPRDRGMIIGRLLLLFSALRQIAYMSTRLISERGAIDRIAVNVPPAEGTENPRDRCTRLISERGAIDRIAVNVPKMPKYIPAVGTENPRDRCTEFSTGNYGAKHESSSSDAKTNTDLLDRTFTNSRMHGKVKPPKIQVFINFRGVQLRNNFISYLVDALRRSEINVFIDIQEQRGEDHNTIFKRIEESVIAIVVFSSRYTESTWCLNELVKIKERELQGLLMVLPIFYKVTPANVIRLKGDFGDHFRDKAYTYQSDEPMIKRWKEAIMFVVHKVALTWDEKSSVLEIDLVEAIVKEVLRMRHKMSEVGSGQSIGRSVRSIVSRL